MGKEQEAIIEAFVEAFEGSAVDMDRLLGYFANDASYRVYAWEEPHVGHAAIRAEFERQAPMFSDFHGEIVTITSTDNMVFTERLDSMNLGPKRVTLHVAGVFELNQDGKITDWRDYLDQQEVAAAMKAPAKS
jgi:limonene-1,2-epoxide hydrolase